MKILLLLTIFFKCLNFCSLNKVINYVISFYVLLLYNSFACDDQIQNVVLPLIFEIC